MQTSTENSSFSGVAPDQTSGQNACLSQEFVFENFFSVEECEQITYLDLTVYQAEVNYHNPEKSLSQLNLKHRNALNKAIPRRPEFEWIYGRLIHKLHQVNRDYYHFDLRSMSDLQLLEYQNTGFYGTHVDIGTGAISNRKLTMVTFLSSPEDYEGGDLVLKPKGLAVPQKQGSLVVFPSYMPHEVCPVTQGIRHSLVAWITGPCFR